MSLSSYVPERAMVIVAHPDDIEFGSAGTVAAWVKGGAEVCYVLCTSGDVGIAEAGMTKAQAAAIREVEQTAAAAAVGVNDVVYLREPDGMLENSIDLRRKLVREIRRFRPEAVICMDPTVMWVGDGYINHPDHRAAGTAAVDAIFPAAGQPNLFEELATEGLRAHKPRKVFVTSFRQGEVAVDITDTIDLKLSALRKHESQMKGWDPEPRVREWNSMAAAGTGAAYAERFRVVTLESDEDWAKRKGDVAKG
ncbi:MAG TPA: PIG-L family deacetylase [Anaerolineae bacterium]|nr:PIG-L family deacetylase [Anaerolineae bacterium]